MANNRHVAPPGRCAGHPLSDPGSGSGHGERGPGIAQKRSARRIGGLESQHHGCRPRIYQGATDGVARIASHPADQTINPRLTMVAPSPTQVITTGGA